MEEQCVYCNRSHGEPIEGFDNLISVWPYTCKEHVEALERRLERIEEHLKIGVTYSEGE